MKTSAAVIGAGTSGLIAARRLAQLGIETYVYDHKANLGVPVVASGIISINGLNSLKIGYKPAVTNTLFGANIHASNKVMRIKSNVPVAHVLDRQKLNEICKEESEAAGAHVITGKKITENALDEIGNSSIIVGADGPLSIVARHFGMGGISKYILTYKAEFEMSIENSGSVDLFFDNKIAPGFFAWHCPNSEKIMEVGIGIDSKHGNSKAAFYKFMGTDFCKDISETGKKLGEHASIIPIRTAKKIVDEGKEVLLIGDAAGQVKPTTGGGIIYGGNAAMMAANAIYEHVKNSKPLKDYEKKFKRKYATDIRLHALAHALYSKLSAKGIGRAITLLNALGMESFLGEYGDMDSPKTILKRMLTRKK